MHRSSLHRTTGFLLLGVISAWGLVCCGISGSQPTNGNDSSTQQHPFQPATSGFRLSPSSGRSFTQGETIRIAYEQDEPTDSALLEIEGSRFPTRDTFWNYPTTLHHRVGSIRYKVTRYHNGTAQQQSGYFQLIPASEAKRYTLSVERTFPHRTDAYTQGLEFHNGDLVESSGEYGKSYIQRRAFPAGTVKAEASLEAKYFAEGATVLKDKLYLLTWQEHTGFVMDAHTLKTERTFAYNSEGWGLTNDGTALYMSDGSYYIYKRDPETFREIGRIEVMNGKDRIAYLNELEWINGEIWANVYTTNIILRIDPASGVVTGIIDAAPLLKQIDLRPETDVLNGIAYDPTTKKIYLTGKNWNKLFEVKIKES